MGAPSPPPPPSPPPTPPPPPEPPPAFVEDEDTKRSKRSTGRAALKIPGYGSGAGSNVGG